MHPGKPPTVWSAIAALMEQKGVNGKTLAQIAGVSPSAVVKWKRGANIGAQHLLRIAMHFGQSVDALLGRVGERSESSGRPAPDPGAASEPNPSTSSRAQVRETPPPYGTQPTPADMYRHMSEACADLAKRMSNLEQAFLSLVAEERRRRDQPDAMEAVDKTKRVG